MRGNRGSAPLELALGIGILLLPAALAVMSFGPWLEQRVFVRSVAAEAARAAVVAVGDPAAAGSGVAADMARSQGLDPGEVQVSLCGGPEVGAGAGSGTCVLVRGGHVVVTVRALTPLIATPWGDVGGVWVSGTHSEPVDPYRSMP